MPSQNGLRILLVGLLLFTGACSSSQQQQKEQDLATDPLLDEGVTSSNPTDAVPQASAESVNLDDEAINDPLATPSAISQESHPEAKTLESVPPPISLDSKSQTKKVSSVPHSSVMPPADAPSMDELSSNSVAELEAYKVKAGDTLMKIAYQNYGSIYKWREIYETNKEKIPNPSHIKAGVILNIPKGAGAPVLEETGEKYIIKRGETLGTIATNIYGSPKKWKKLWENNKQSIQNPNKIFAGFLLYYVLTPEEASQRNAAQVSQNPSVGAAQVQAQPGNPQVQQQYAPPAAEPPASQMGRIPDAPALPESWQGRSNR